MAPESRSEEEAAWCRIDQVLNPGAWVGMMHSLDNVDEEKGKFEVPFPLHEDLQQEMIQEKQEAAKKQMEELSRKQNARKNILISGRAKTQKATSALRAAVKLHAFSPKNQGGKAQQQDAKHEHHHHHHHHHHSKEDKKRAKRWDIKKVPDRSEILQIWSTPKQQVFMEFSTTYVFLFLFFVPCPLYVVKLSINIFQTTLHSLLSLLLPDSPTPTTTVHMCILFQ
jgi:hypothetical protein